MQKDAKGNPSQEGSATLWSGVFVCLSCSRLIFWKWPQMKAAGFRVISRAPRKLASLNELWKGLEVYDRDIGGYHPC